MGRVVVVAGAVGFDEPDADPFVVSGGPVVTSGPRVQAPAAIAATEARKDRRLTLGSAPLFVFPRSQAPP